MASLLLLSHSHKIVEGIRELCLQMAGEAEIATVGGTKEGDLGTDYDRIFETLQRLAEKGDVVVLADVGSALMTGEMAADALEEPLRGRVHQSSAALVEGALVAAVSIAAGQPVTETLAALEEFNLSK